MPSETVNIDAEYHRQIDALSPCERVARAAAMCVWFREMIGRQLVQDFAARGKVLAGEELKLRIALRVYASEPAVMELIQRSLDEIGA